MAKLIQWLDQNVGAIQALSSVAVAVLTLFLVSFTRRYVHRTGEMLDVTRDQLRLLEQQAKEEARALALAHEQFEQEWKPDLRISLVWRPNQDGVSAKVANLVKPSALITAIRIASGSSKDIVTFPKSDLILGGVATEIAVKSELLQYRELKNPSAPIWETGQIGISFIYYCAGRTLETDWYHLSVSFKDQSIERVVPA